MWETDTRKIILRSAKSGTSLEVEWLRLRLLMWGGVASSQAKKQNIKRKQYCNKFSKDFKNGPH